MKFRILLLIGALVLAVAGCGKAPTARVEAARDGGTGDSGQSAPAPLPGGITGTNWHIPWRTADPKHPHAKPVTVLIADAKSGTMTSKANNLVLRLGGVRAQLFSERRHVADLQAARVETDRRSRIVVATRDVRLVSLTNPPDAVLTSDRMTWDTHTKILVATGNAHFVRRQPGKPLLDDQEPVIKYNIETGDIDTDATP